MNVLVTGGLGVNGAPVVRKLVERGVTPIVVDIRPDLTLLGAEIAKKIQLVQADSGDASAMNLLLKHRSLDCIIHMAAVVGDAQVDPLETVRVNVYGTVQLMALACEHKVRRFVFTSSRGAYGGLTGSAAHPTYVPVAEDHPLRPAAVYDVCKVAAEGIGRNYAKDRGLEFVALRFSTIFGPGKTLRHKNYGIVSRVIEDGLAGVPVRVAGGDQQDDMIYVEDAAEAILAAANAAKPAYTEYNISNGRGYTLHDLAAAVRALRPDADIEIRPGLNYMGWDTNYAGVLDNRRASADLGFRPSFDLHAAVADYAQRMASLPRS